VEPGKYYHFGILNGIKQNITDYINENEIIQIVVGTDGLPIFKSSPEQFWPVLAYIQPNNNEVFPVGIYCGKVKPIDSNEFLKEFVDEAKVLSDSGVYVNNKTYKLSKDVFCCDAPAKSFILKTKGHSGFFPAPDVSTKANICQTEFVFHIPRLITVHPSEHIIIMF